MENEVGLLLEDVELETALCVKDLGLHICSNVSWRTHINIKIGKAKQVYHQIKRNIPYSAPSKTKSIQLMYSIPFYYMGQRFGTLTLRISANLNAYNGNYFF